MANKTFSQGFFAKILDSSPWRVTFLDANEIQFELSDTNQFKTHSLAIHRVQIETGIVWDSVHIHLLDKPTIKLKGLKADKAKQLQDTFIRYVEADLVRLIQENKSDLDLMEQALAPAIDAYHSYLSKWEADSAIQYLGERNGNALNSALKHPLLDLNHPKLSNLLPRTVKLILSGSSIEQYNQEFVNQALIRDKAFFDNFAGMSLSEEQREACIRAENNDLLVACAGSGKTATIVAKVAYVIKKGFYKPSEILVLAFNRDAANELRTRIQKQIGKDLASQPMIATFHAFGKQVIQKVEGKPPKLANWVENEASFSRELNNIIDELAHTDEKFSNDWKTLLTIYPRSNKELDEITEEKQIDAYRQSGKTITALSGVNVRSIQELRIANWLFLQQVPFEYERQVNLIQTKTNEEGESIEKTVTVHADFYYPTIDAYHEHFAIDEQGISPFAGYERHVEQKRQGYKNVGIKLIETTSGDASNGNLLIRLEKQLRERGVELNTMSLEELSKRLDPIILKQYHSLIATALKHIKNNRLSKEDLVRKARAFEYPARALLFSNIMGKISETYEQRLRAAKCIDFEDMISISTDMIASRRFESPFKFIVADEFQDISASRAGIIQSLKEQVPGSKFFAVGDDWQSIYRFSGSDLDLFTRFEKHFGKSWIGKLQQTYRCNQFVAQTAADFVQENPKQLKKEVRSTRQAIPKSIQVVLVEDRIWNNDWSQHVMTILNRINHTAQKKCLEWQTDKKPKLSVLVLFRYNAMNPFRGKKPVFSHIEVDTYSFHRSKGLEADYTVLVNVSEEDYGVPSKIEDDELLKLVIPEAEQFEFAEERRLFYVALTRCSKACFILTSKKAPSRFIHELKDLARGEIPFSDIHGEAIKHCPKCKTGVLIKRKSKFGLFYGCSNHPDCNHTKNL